ncbi:MAG TPA: SRPBCC domain-containing protein [Opitutaceae bacterium]|nr:SRPBCC domain-containing protein [Opitutaceae bacterium]
MKTILLPALLLTTALPAMTAEPTPLTDATIVRAANVAADRDATWAAWTRADELKKWFGRDALVDPTLGGPYEIYFLIDEPFGQRGGEGNKVQAVLPGRMLAFTWNAPPSFGPLRDVRTHVVLEFADHHSGGTTVTLTHYGWPAGDDWAKVREYFEGAWTRVMAKLEKHLGVATGANPANDRKIDYVEFVVPDIAKAKAFYSAVFGWRFTDYGPDYCDFRDGRITGGFAKGELPAARGALVVTYASDLEATEERITGAGGAVISRHDFPGGRRLHFKDTNGLELAAWTDRKSDGSRIE